MENSVALQDFGGALTALKAGKCVARAGWNAHHMLELRAADENMNILSYVSMIIGPDAKDLAGKIIPWVCSQTDMLAEDWSIVEPIAA